MERGARVDIVVDGATVKAYEGESVAAAVMAAGFHEQHEAYQRRFSLREQNVRC